MTHPRLSADRIEALSATIDPVFCCSAQPVAPDLSAALGLRLVLKVETLNPLRSFKGRGADAYVRGLPADGAPLACASAGNFGQAMAYAGVRAGRAVHVWAATGASPVKVARMRALGAVVHLAGDDFDEAKAIGREAAERAGWSFVEDAREVAISEGAGTIGVELTAPGGTLDVAVLPVGNGALAAGIGCWLRAVSPKTRLIAVSAAGAPAMERSWRAGTPVTTDDAATIADGVATRVPVPEAVADLASLELDDWVLVDDAATLQALRDVHADLGLVVEPAGAIGVAAVRQLAPELAGATVATVLTGANVLPEVLAGWLAAR